MKSYATVGSHTFSWPLTCYFISGIVEENKLRRVRMAYAVSSFMEYHDILKMWRIKHNSLEDGCQ